MQWRPAPMMCRGSGLINAQGKISERPGSQRQRHLLEGEGIVFVNDKVDLKRYQWQGPGHEDTPQQATLF
ncbi:MAG: hypothetical protein R2932_38310 [Caldilineaceae bacterium]